MRTALGGFAVALGLVGGLGLLGHQIQTSVDNFIGRDRVVTVKGLAERLVEADDVIWPITFRELGNDLAGVNATLDKRAECIMAFLQAGGIARDAMTLSTPRVEDAEANVYNGSKRAWRYALTQTVTVHTTEVAKVRSLMAQQKKLLEEGVTLANDYGQQVEYAFTQLNNIKPAMIETATLNAREAALKFAKDSGSSLGKIRRANQGQFSITDRDSTTAHIKKVRVVTTVEYFLKD